MRSINQRKNKKPIIILVTLAALLLVGGGLVYWALTGPFASQVPVSVEERPTNSIDYGAPTQPELESQAEQKDDIVKESNQENTASSNQSDVTANIIRADQMGPGEPLNIRVQIDGATSGTCEVKLTKDGQPTVEKSFSVVLEATSSRCLDADIPAASFGASGEWNLSVIIKTGSKQSLPAVKSITVEK